MVRVKGCIRVKVIVGVLVKVGIKLGMRLGSILDLGLTLTLNFCGVMPNFWVVCVWEPKILWPRERLND